MERITDYLGLPVLSLKARTAVMRELKNAKQIGDKTSTSSKLLFHRDSLDILRLDEEMSDYMLKSISAEDDDTASTASMGDEMLSCSDSNNSSVTFAETLVSAVYTRPTTTMEEKRDLFYSDKDYRQFRREYHLRKRCSLVQFPSASVVTDVYEYPSPENTEALYYSESDLQRFLNDFVSSLNGGFR